MSGGAKKKGREGKGSNLREGFVWFSWSENKNNVNCVSLVLPEQNAPSSQTRPGMSLGIWRGSFCELLIASFHMVSLRSHSPLGGRQGIILDK